MTTLQLIKSKKPCTLYFVISWLFLLSGGKIYLDYILITNPTSKNPLIKLIFGFMRKFYTANDVDARYFGAWSCGVIHFVFMIVYACIGSMWSVGNILVNVYPIIIQLYIGYRLYRIRACL